MEQNTAKGAGFLKVTGILMIIGSVFGIIGSIITLLGIAALSYISDGQIDTGMLYAAGVLLLAGAVAELIAGIIGVKNCNKPEKAGTCIVWGVIVAAISIIGAILTTVGGNSFPVVSLLTGLIVPVLFIVGALKNKNSYGGNGNAELGDL